jgi:hypothetical protein
MNPYGLPTDQLAQYRVSQHGRALFEKGDEHVATCSSCHGTHGIEGPQSRDSPVHPTRVPETCARCHADPKLMEPYGLDPEIPKAWHAGVHAALLLDEGDLSAPSCATCHGSHGAVPPGFRTVAAVCGQCHVREMELFEASPHAPLAEAGDFAGCEVCHGNHEVRPAEPVIFDRLCGLCHVGEDEPLARRDAIAGALRAGEDLLTSTREEGRVASAQGLMTENDRLLLVEAESALQRARIVQHALDVERLEEPAGEAREKLQRLTTQIEEEREEQRIKRLSVAPVVVFLVLMSLGFWARYRRIHARTEGVPHGGSAT